MYAVLLLIIVVLILIFNQLKLINVDTKPSNLIGTVPKPLSKTRVEKLGKHIGITSNWNHNHVGS